MNIIARLLRPALAFAAISLAGTATAQAQVAPLRACVDPGNMPLSNDKGEGYHNKIAHVLAKAMGTTASFFYRPYLERGLTRQTFDNNECDVLFDMSLDDERMLVTKPLYRSTFVLAYRNDRGWDITTLNDNRLLAALKVGVFQHSALRTVLQERGLRRDNTFVHTISHDADIRPERQPHQQVQRVVDGKLDVAAVWGPLAGWYRTLKNAPITIVPVNRMEDVIPMEFSLAVGLPRRAAPLKPRVERAIADSREEIRRILVEYGVPLVQCSDCTISGDIPSHGPYAERQHRQAAGPAQTDKAQVATVVKSALDSGSSWEQELHNAALAGDAVRVEYVLQQKPTLVDVRDEEGQTPLMVAARSGYTLIVNGLLALGAGPNAQDRDGWTAAMHSVRRNDGSLMRLLARGRADLDKVNADGLTVLALAVTDNRVNAAVAALDSGAKPDVPLGPAKYTALMLAVRAGNLPLAQTLLQYGAQVNARNAAGITPLMIAAARDQDMLISLLLKSGADPRWVNADGKTALDLARDSEAKKAVAALDAAARGS